MPPSRYGSAESRLTLMRQLLEATRAIPGVERAGIVTVNPLARGSFGAPIETEDRLLQPREAALIVNHRLVSVGWLETAGVPLVRGRAFTAADNERSTPVAIVSRRMAQRLWPGADPIGKRIRFARPNMPWLTVVGLAGDVRDFGEWRDTWYLPYRTACRDLVGCHRAPDGAVAGGRRRDHRGAAAGGGGDRPAAARR